MQSLLEMVLAKKSCPRASGSWRKRLQNSISICNLIISTFQVGTTLKSTAKCCPTIGKTKSVATMPSTLVLWAGQTKLPTMCLCGALCFCFAVSLISTSICVLPDSCRASLHPWCEEMARPDSPVKLTCTSCAKTPRVSTPALAGACTLAPSVKL